MPPSSRSGSHQHFRVVKNAAGQYALLPAHLTNPAGWQDAGKTGSADECQAFVREHWTETRPAEAPAGDPDRR